jgi:hypothetical protein
MDSIMINKTTLKFPWIFSEMFDALQDFMRKLLHAGYKNCYPQMVTGFTSRSNHPLPEKYLSNANPQTPFYICTLTNVQQVPKDREN